MRRQESHWKDESEFRRNVRTGDTRMQMVFKAVQLDVTSKRVNVDRKGKRPKAESWCTPTVRDRSHGIQAHGGEAGGLPTELLVGCRTGSTI